MRQILSLSGSATIQNLIGMASWVGLVRILATFGSDALAGYTIAVRLIIFALLPSWGLSNAAATMVGQSLGAKRPDRAEKSVWRAGRYNAAFLTAVGVLFYAGAPLILKAFTSDPAVTDYAVNCLRIVALGFPLYAYGMVLTQSFNGAGDTWTPTWLNFICFWAFEIPFAWWLAHAGRSRADGGVLGDHGVVLGAGGGERGGVQAGKVEDEGGVADHQSGSIDSCAATSARCITSSRRCPMRRFRLRRSSSSAR